MYYSRRGWEYDKCCPTPVAAWLCRTLLDVDECRSKRPADMASDVAISTSKVKSSRRNVQRFDRVDSLRRIRISGKSTSASRNIIRTKLHVFLFFFGMAVFFMRGVLGKVRFPPYARFRRVRSEGMARKTNPRSEKNGCRELNIRGMRKRGKIKVAEIYVCIAKVLFRSKKHPFFDTTNIEFSARQKSAKFLVSRLSHYITL
mgnify:CR=1 FL=1